MKATCPTALWPERPSVAVDSETMGLRLGPRSALRGAAQRRRRRRPRGAAATGPAYDAPNLKRLLTDPAVLKIFHFGRFDIAMFLLHLGVVTAPVYCTKIASKLARTYTDRHGLKDVIRELLGVDLSKAQQSSDWGAAAADARAARLRRLATSRHLHALKARLDAMLEREGRMGLAQACFDFLPIGARSWTSPDGTTSTSSPTAEARREPPRPPPSQVAGRARSRRQARAHSRLVLVLRWLLPAADRWRCSAVLAACVVGAGGPAPAAAHRRTLPTPDPHDQRRISIGRDNQGRAFILAARQAARDEPTSSGCC